MNNHVKLTKEVKLTVGGKKFKTLLIRLARKWATSITEYLELRHISTTSADSK